VPPSFRRDDPPQVQTLGQLLSVAAGSLAAEHRVDPQLLATTSDLQDLVRWRLGKGNGKEEPAVLQGWRGAILGRPLLDVLDGKRSVRVRDLKADAPLVFETS
jgi:ribonuclease D